MMILKHSLLSHGSFSFLFKNNVTSDSSPKCAKDNSNIKQ